MKRDDPVFREVMRRKGQVQYYDTLMARGETEAAAKYAKRSGLVLSGTTATPPPLNTVAIAAPAVAPERPKPVPRPKVAAAPVEMVNGWPTYATGVIWATCPNVKLVVIKFPDGRTASMWREGLGDKPIGVRVDVEIAKRLGDVIYKWVRNSADQSEGEAVDHHSELFASVE